MESTILRTGFSDKCGADVQAFLVTNDNFVMRRDNEEDKSAWLFAYLDGDKQASHRGKVYP